MPLPRPLEPAAGPSNSDRLIHDPFTDTEVLVDPFRNVLVFASSSVGLETRPRSSQRGMRQPSSRFSSDHVDRCLQESEVMAFGHSRQASGALHAGEDRGNCETKRSATGSKRPRQVERRTENGIDGVVLVSGDEMVVMQMQGPINSARDTTTTNGSTSSLQAARRPACQDQRTPPKQRSGHVFSTDKPWPELLHGGA
ncbi:hypothetical protein VDGL01_07221 [Verticillium dahliae]